MIFNSKVPWWLRSLSALMLVVATASFFISGLLWAFVASLCLFLAAVAYAKATGKA